VLTREQAQEIVHALHGLPADKMLEVKDFILFLKQCYGLPPQGYCDDWEEEDVQGLVNASMKHADQTCPE
jgi:hypothetical protein